MQEILITPHIDYSTYRLIALKLEEKLLWGPIGTYQRSFQWHHPRPPIQPPLTQDWGSHPTENSNRHYLRTSNLARTFRGSVRTKAQ